MAQLAGFPKAWQQNEALSNGRLQSSDRQAKQRHSLEAKAKLWEGICAVDRLSCMILNLLAATATYHFPPRPTFLPNGKVIGPAYMFQLATIGTKARTGY